MARRWAANLDMYRKVPGDLVEGTREGRALSWAVVLLILTLFFQETRQFLSTSIATDLALDSSSDSDYIRVNFNITMLDLRCEYAAIDVVSVLGTQQNVSKNINKWTVDSEGIRQRLLGRNTNQNDIQMSDSKVTQSIEELHRNGEDAVSLDSDTFEFAKNEFEYLFVDFYASWCSHCRDLAPTWETLAEVMVDAAETSVGSEIRAEEDYTAEEYKEALQLEMPVVVAKIDCVDHKELCRDQGIRSYPTLRLFIDGETHSEYMGHRTVLAMTQFLEGVEERHRSDLELGGRWLNLAQDAVKKRLNVSEEEKQWAEGVERSRHATQSSQWNPDDHPGCQLSGTLMLNRVPGNFFIQARSKSHDLAPHMTNVSHEIHHLSFGDDRLIKHLKLQTDLKFPGNLAAATTPMNGNVYVTPNLHEAYHHYLKLVSTNFDNQIKTAWMKSRGNNGIGQGLKAYQVLQSTELAFYRNDIVPEAKFIIDLSPIAVSYKPKSRKFYEYITSLMAIIGGTFTVLGFLEAGMRTVVSKKGSGGMSTPVKRRY